MRTTPRILSLHMSMAASYWQARFEEGAQDAAAIQAEFQDMLRGIQLYMAHDYARDNAHLDVVFERGASCVLKLNEHDYGDAKPVVMLIPSLINKAHIFDITAQQSMLRYFCAQGLDAYLLDWGEFLFDPEMQDLDGVVCSRMRMCVDALAEEAGADIHAVGYCMGGSLLAGLAALDDVHLKSLTFMATPWDFHAGSQGMLNRVKFWSPSLMASLKKDGQMKVDWLQILFSSLYPEQAMKKFAKFSKMDVKSDATEVFVAVEDWLNDGVPLPAMIGSAAVKDWFLDNGLVRGEWVLNAQQVDVSNVKLPSFFVASSRDKLVEYDAAVALFNGLENAAIHDPKCGHVGMIAGAKAIDDVWSPIVNFIHKTGT